MEKENKITNAQKYAMIADILAQCEPTDGNEDVKATLDMLIEFCNTQIAALDRKKENAKARGEASKEATKAFIESLRGVLTGEFQSREALAAQLGEDVTLQKISANINKIEGVEKGKVTEGDKEVVAYRLA